MQKSVRGHLARKQHLPRIKGIRKINSIRHQIKQTEQIANQLKSGKDSTLVQVTEIYKLIDNSVNQIKVRKSTLKCLIKSKNVSFFYFLDKYKNKGS